LTHTVYDGLPANHVRLADKLFKRVFVCCSGFDDSIYADLYDGNDNIVSKMVEAGFAVSWSPTSSTVQFHHRVARNQVTDGDEATDDAPEFVLVPG